jgi:hypothetical protein
MCGTSIKQIEQTYFHLTDEMMMTTATVKKLILEFNLTKGDLRGKAMKHLEA